MVQQRGPDFNMNFEVSLEDLYNGRRETLRLKRNVICTKCKGTGAEGGAVTTCTKCGGRGVEMVTQNMGPGFQVQMQQPCSVCGGKGKMFKKKCPHCGGNKVLPEDAMLKLAIDRGMSDGNKVTFDGMSEQNPSYKAPGNVVVTLKQQPHAVFTRKGDNLAIAMTLTLREALLGFSRQIRHLDNHVVTVARTEVTHHGAVLIIKGEGMPIKGTTSFGDLEVSISVTFPQSLTPENVAAVQTLFADS